MPRTHHKSHHRSFGEVGWPAKWPERIFHIHPTYIRTCEFSSKKKFARNIVLPRCKLWTKFRQRPFATTYPIFFQQKPIFYESETHNRWRRLSPEIFECSENIFGCCVYAKGDAFRPHCHRELFQKWGVLAILLEKRRRRDSLSSAIFWHHLTNLRLKDSLRTAHRSERELATIMFATLFT